MFGFEKELLSNISFQAMSALFWFRDLVAPVDKKVNRWHINPGDVVVDVGCGPGSYLRAASALVGDEGKVYAVDIHPLAIRTVQKKIREQRLANVIALLTQNNHISLADNTADFIYAMDMFHMVKDTKAFLQELWRIAKPSGVLLIESGHQPVSLAMKKLKDGALWEVSQLRSNTFICTPRNK